MKNIVYNPGCALILYKPEYSEKVLNILRKKPIYIISAGICTIKWHNILDEWIKEH